MSHYAALSHIDDVLQNCILPTFAELVLRECRRTIELQADTIATLHGAVTLTSAKLREVEGKLAGDQREPLPLVEGF